MQLYEYWILITRAWCQLNEMQTWMDASSKFKFYSRIAAFVVKSWQAKQRPLKQPEQKCLEAQMTAKKFYFVTEFWWDVFDFLTLAAKSFSLRKLFQSGKFWIRTKVSSLIYLSLDSKKGHLKPTNSFQVRKSPEEKVLNLQKSHFYEKKNLVLSEKPICTKVSCTSARITI